MLGQGRGPRRTIPPAPICASMSASPAAPAGAPDDEICPGLRLYRALSAALARAGEAAPPVRIESVECLVGLQAPLHGRGHLARAAGPMSTAISIPKPRAADDPRRPAGRYAATRDGIVPWRERPETFRKGVVARIPPFTSLSSTKGAAA